jgi:hypothetical protein
MQRFILNSLKIILVVFSTTCLFSCSSEPKQLSEVTSVAEAKERIDWYMAIQVKKYQELCAGPRNDTQKGKFLELAAEIGEIYQAGAKCEKLDAEYQSEVFDYAMSSLHSNKDFLALLNENRCNCW